MDRPSSGISMLWGIGHMNEAVTSLEDPSSPLWWMCNAAPSRWLPVWQLRELTRALGQDFQRHLALLLHFNGFCMTLLNKKDDFVKEWTLTTSGCWVNPLHSFILIYPVSLLGEERSELLNLTETALDLSFHMGLPIRNELTNLDLGSQNLSFWVLSLCHCPFII